MNPTQLFKTFFKHDLRHGETVAKSFQPGQIMSGKITKLYLNQTAEVQIGSQKVIAQLDAPLSTNEQYWFQVQPGEGKIHLKVISQLSNRATQNPDSLETILPKLGLQSTKENNALVRFMISEHLPMYKENIMLASQWLKETQHLDQGFATIKMMAGKGLPFTKDIFSALLSLQDKEPIHHLMRNLSTSLQQSTSSTAIKLTNVISKLILPTAEKLGNSALPLIIEEWLTAKTIDGNAPLSLMKAVGIFPKGATEDTLFSQLKMNIERANHEKNDVARIKPIVNFLTDFTSQPKTEISNQAAHSDNSKLTDTKDFSALKTAILNLLSEPAPLPEITSRDLLSEKTSSILSLFGAEEKEVAAGMKQLSAIMTERMSMKGNDGALSPLTSEELALIDKMIMQVEGETVDWTKGERARSELKGLLTLMGFDYESELNLHGLPHEKDKIDSLKPLLIKLLNEHPQERTQEAAEQLLNRITGVQLLSHDIGPLQQIVLQLPISFLEKTFDLTVQWSGKKNEEGKVDPDFCRVLFYLELEHLGDTIVDMQVQSRIITIGIINESNNLKAISSPLIPTLKEKLKSMNYHLSAITFSQPTNLKGNAVALTKRVSSKYDNKAYSGVDFRI